MCVCVCVCVSHRVNGFKAYRMPVERFHKMMMTMYVQLSGRCPSLFDIDTKYLFAIVNGNEGLLVIVACPLEQLRPKRHMDSKQITGGCHCMLHCSIPMTIFFLPFNLDSPVARPHTFCYEITSMSFLGKHEYSLSILLIKYYFSET